MGHTAAPQKILDLVNEVMEAHHPELVQNEVTVLVQMHTSFKGLRLRGVPCYAIAKITNEKDRAKSACLPDARITIDSISWADLPAETQRAVIDHELQHFALCYDKKSGELKEDDNGRPKLKMRPHDIEFGHFKIIAERHGSASVEARQLQTLVDESGQLIWPWSGTSRDTADNATVTLSTRGRSVRLTRDDQTVLTVTGVASA
jgi:hypothetical protein